MFSHYTLNRSPGPRTPHHRTVDLAKIHLVDIAGWYPYPRMVKILEQPENQKSEIIDPHEWQSVGSSPGVCNWAGEPGTAPPKRVLGCGESGSAGALAITIKAKTTFCSSPPQFGWSPVGDVASAVENAWAAYSGTIAAPHEYFDQTGSYFCGPQRW